MRPASPAPDRHRQDTESLALNRDEGFHPHRHEYNYHCDCDLDCDNGCDQEEDQDHETELDHYLATAVVDAPMIDAPVATAIASTTTTDIETSALAASSSVHDDDIDTHPDDPKDNHRNEATSSDSNPVQLSTRQTVTVDEFFGIAHHHEHDPESDLNYQDYDLEMSDSDGGAPIDEEQTPTDLVEPESVPQTHINVFTPHPLLENASLPSLEHLGFNYYTAFPHPTGLGYDIMNPLQQPGTWVAIPQAMPVGQAAGNQPGPLQALPPLFDPMMDDPVLISNPNPTMLGSENLGLIDFLRSWTQMSRFQSSYIHAREGVPHIEGIREQASNHRDEVMYTDLKGDACDMQGVDWASMGVTRSQARHKREKTYKNYVNKQGSDQWAPHMEDVNIGNPENYFRFKKMHLRQDVHLAHFQLRSVLACPANNQAFYSASRGINRINPVSRKTELALSMSEFTGLGAMISTLDANHGLLMAGTFNGEYCLKNLESEDKKNFSDGQITSDPNGITNHLQINPSRRSGGPVAAISSNDNGFRMMDLTTEKMLSETRFPFAMNCTAISPDRRLRVMVGDNCNVLIVNSETGQIQQRLSGHRDFGFACDWSDDGWTVATGFQDKGVKIWDARYWCNANGESRPICTIRSEMAGVRGLRFSPEGSGRKVLVAAEEADFINIIDAETFATKQTIDIFGEIGGIAFTNEGQDLSILCCDRHRGGLLQLERCGGGPEPFYNNSWSRQVQYWGWQNDRDDSLHIDEFYRRRPTMLDSLPIF